MKDKISIDVFSKFVNKTNDDKYAKLNREDIIMSEDLGKGYNIGSALKYIGRYRSEGFSKSSNKEDLLKAAHSLIMEYNRVTNLKL